MSESKTMSTSIPDENSGCESSIQVGTAKVELSSPNTYAVMGDNTESSLEGIDDANDESHIEDESLKLFVGQVPRSMDENELKPVMESYGDIADIVIIRDKLTGAHRGCAFVTFSNRKCAERAVEELHNKVTLPPSMNPLQVRPAEGQAGASSQEHKLFIGMIPKSADEHAIKTVFEPFGDIEEVYILRHQVSGQSKGCAFLKYKERNAAVMAIESVHGKVTMEGGSTTLVVKFADSRRQRLQRARTQLTNAAAAAYWQMPPGTSIPFPQLQQMQQQYVQQMQAFGAQNNANANGNAFMYYNPYAFGAYGYPPYGFPGIPGVTDPTGITSTTSVGQVATTSDSTSHQTVSSTSVSSDAIAAVHKATKHSGQLEGPPGANLFIYHLPHDLTDADLATAFAPFGTVISAKVYMDKNTGESKGFGFVSYDAASAADAAITSMNGFQIGSKRLKVQHKRVHSRDDIAEGSTSSNESGAYQAEFTGDEGIDEKGDIGEDNVLEQSVQKLHLDG